MDIHPILINMDELVDIVKNRTTIVPKTILEIGSLHGKDSLALKTGFNVPDSSVFICEPHPDHYQYISETFNFNVFEIAIGEIDLESIEFNAIDTSLNQNFGISSALKRNDNATYITISVPQKSLKTFIQDIGVDEVSILKIDVEGLTWEVLHGLDDYIHKVRCLHIEAEHIPVWENQKLCRDCEDILIDAGFMCVGMKMAWPQSDSVWIKPVDYKTKWWI